MKKHLIFIAAAAFLFAAGYTSCRKDKEATLVSKENRNHDFTLENATMPSYFDSFYDETSIWSNNTETSERMTDRGELEWIFAQDEMLNVDETMFNAVATLPPSITADGITVGTNLMALPSGVTIGDVGAEFTAKPVFTWVQTTNTITDQPDEGTTKVKRNNTAVTVSCGSFTYTHQASATFRYTPEVQGPTFTGATVKPGTLNWGTPNVNVVLVGLGAWPPGSYIKADYTGSVTLVLSFSDGSTKDSLVTNLQASTTAKLEKVGRPPNWVSGTPFVESIIQNSPVPAVVVDQYEADAVATDIIHFTFIEGEFFLEYSIANSVVSVPVRGVNIPIPFGNGILTMTALQKTFVSGVGQDGKVYAVYNIFPTIAFTHPVGNLQEECPRHFIQVAEPRP